MADSFETQIDTIVVNTEQRLLNVMVTAIQAVGEDAQTPVAKGGKMRVDTGFLRASGVASLNAVPRGAVLGRRRLPGETGKPLTDYIYDGEAFLLTLAKMKFGDVFYFGWTAKYAKYREAYDGFLESALQKWQSHVDKAVAYYKDKDMRK